MPIFNYKCRKCKNVAEVIQKSSDPAPQCVLCGGDTEKQVSGSQSFYFKGEGTYSEKSMAPKKGKQSV